MARAFKAFVPPKPVLWPSPWSPPRLYPTPGDGACPAPAARCRARPGCGPLWRGRRDGRGRPPACGGGGGAQKGLCRVGREVSHPGPSPEPDKEISTIRLVRCCDSWLHTPEPHSEQTGGERSP